MLQSTSRPVSTSAPASIPQVGRTVVSRPRLSARLDAAGRTSRIVIVGAAVGAGKTTALASWVGQLGPRDAVCWKSLGHGRSATIALDGVLADFLPTVPQSTSVTGDRRWPTPRWMDPDVARRWVILDDFPVGRADEIDDRLERLLHGEGPQLSLVLSCPGVPAVDLQRLGAGPECRAVDTEDLALDEEEIDSVLGRWGIRTTPSLVEEVSTRTQGWAWGVRLAGSWLARCSSRTEALRELDLALSSYLENSVLRGLTPDHRRLLSHTSMVADTPAALADEVLGEADPPTPTLTAQTRGFVQVRADGSFVAHPLLRRHLLDQLRRRPVQARDATRRAARLSADRGDLAGAVGIAVEAGDWVCAADLQIASLWVTKVLALGAHLPDPVAVVDGVGRADPLLRAAVALGRSWPDVATRAMAEVSGGAGAGTDADVTVSATLSRALVSMALARWQGDTDSGLRHHRQALSLLPSLALIQRAGTPELMPLLLAHLGHFELAAGAPDRARAALERGARAFRKHPPGIETATQLAAADCLGQLAWVDALSGELTSALRRARDVLTARPADSSEVGVVYAQLASVWCELSRSEFEHAVQRFEGLMSRPSNPADAAMMPEIAAAIGLTAARVAGLVGHGRVSHEIRQLCTASTSAQQIEQQLHLVQAEAELDADEPTGALRLVGDGGPLSSEVCALRARAWLQLGDRASVAATLRSRAVGSVSLLTRIQLELVEAWLAQAPAEQGHRRALVDRALRTAQAEQLRTPIAWAKPWLHDVLAADPALLRRHGAFLASIRCHRLEPVESIPAQASVVLASSLTEREIDILQRLGALSTNEEIAADLFLSPNTIKTHLRSLYRKLDVTRRSDAFRRGRALGLC